MTSTNEKLLVQSEALKKITEHNRDFLSLSITLPLGNLALKSVHTNQWLFTELPKEFDLANWTILAKTLNSSSNRWSGYVKNRWYIEGCNIKVKGRTGTMELSLNAFPSSYSSYNESIKNMQKSYRDTANKNTSSSSSNKNKTKAISNGKNTTLKGGQGKTIDNLVKNIVGNQTDPLKKAKLIHGWLQKEVKYKRYCCAKYKTAEQCYKNRRALNCADTATLSCRMMLSAGLNAYIVHRTHNNGHFWTVIVINGKYYVSDPTGSGSAWNTLWYSNGNRHAPGGKGGNWDRKNGNFPDCYPSYGC